MSDKASPSTSSVFDVAKVIAESLVALPKEQQSLALRFASESLGLANPLTSSSTVPPSVPNQTVIPPNQFTPHPTLHPTQDIRSFVRSKAPSTDIYLAVVVAYFHRFVATTARKESISADDLVEAIRLVGGKKIPPRPNQTLNNAKAAGYLDSDGGGLFRVNSVGENLVNMILGGTGESETKPKTVRKRKPVKVAAKVPGKRRAK